MRQSMSGERGFELKFNILAAVTIAPLWGRGVCVMGSSRLLVRSKLRSMIRSTIKNSKTTGFLEKAWKYSMGHSATHYYTMAQTQTTRFDRLQVQTKALFIMSTTHDPKIILIWYEWNHVENCHHHMKSVISRSYRPIISLFRSFRPWSIICDNELPTTKPDQLIIRSRSLNHDLKFSLTILIKCCLVIDQS